MTLREQLMRDEGRVLHPYKDSVGKLTIGYGRNLDDVGISEQEAELMLDSDIQRTNIDLHAYLPWVFHLDKPRLGVLANMAFNMGIGGLLQFKKMLAAVQASDWERASAEMLDSKWAHQVGERATRLAAQMRDGVWR